MAPRLRRLALTVHVLCSVGWIGAAASYLALGITAQTSNHAPTVRAAWTAMNITGWYIIVPLGISALATGLLMSLGTRWGLLKHYWVLIALILTSLSLAVLILHMPSVPPPHYKSPLLTTPWSTSSTATSPTPPGESHSSSS